MATIVGETPNGSCVTITWAYDCGHEDELFYGGRQFAEADEYIAAKTECLRCENARLVAEDILKLMELK